MKNGVQVTGMVLSSMPIGEYDRRISLLTRELGKISVFAKGARKPKGAFVACTQTFAYGEFTVFPGRAYTLIGAEIGNYFEEFRDDFEKMYRGMYFCEVAGFFAQEGLDESERLKLLYATLTALSKGRMDPVLLKAVFDLRMLVIEGEGPEVTSCVGCRKPYSGGDSRFGLHEGGLLCEDCFVEDSIPVHDGTVRALNYICHAELSKLFSFELTEERRAELCDVVRQYFALHVDRKFKSEEMYGL